ncbi:MAG: methyltransferase domain-containing protein, partial [bacterium]|nr:methyltransferase domain-containing protein [bacterium]
MYSLEAYGHMIADKVRMDAYEEALRRTVKPGSVAVDIGAGTGIMSMMACRLGAERVYAIEPSEFIHVAAHVAKENGYEDRIQFIQGTSQWVDLPEQADVVVSDLRGVLPWLPGHIEAIVDARNRLLKPEGQLIPLRDTVRVAIVEAEELHDSVCVPWSGKPRGFAMETARNATLNTWRKAQFSAEQVMSESAELTTIDYSSVEKSAFAAEVDLAVTRAGTAYGFVCWFDATLVPGVEFSNQPGGDELVYQSAFFPFAEPVSVARGHHAQISLKFREVSGKDIWLWKVSIRDANTGDSLAEFTQSTVFNAPAS